MEFVAHMYSFRRPFSLGRPLYDQESERSVDDDEIRAGRRIAYVSTPELQITCTL